MESQRDEVTCSGFEGGGRQHTVMVKNRLWSRVAEVRIKWVSVCQVLTAMLAISVEVSTIITIFVGMVVVIILLLSSSVDLLRNLFIILNW